MLSAVRSGGCLNRRRRNRGDSQVFSCSWVRSLAPPKELRYTCGPSACTAHSPTRPGALHVYDERGTRLKTVVHAWDNPEGLLFDESGALWVAETARGELWRIGNDDHPRRVETLPLPVVLVRLPNHDLLVNRSGKGARLLRVTLGPR